jgi:hypothetical protein
MRREIEWELPLGIWGQQHRHIIGYGIEVTCWSKHSSASFENGTELRLHTGSPYNYLVYENNDDGRRKLQSELWRMKHVFEAGMAYKQSRILAELGVRT